MLDLDIRGERDVVAFPVKAMPRSTRNAIDGTRERALVVRLVAPAVEGKANAALIAYLADVLKVKKKQVSIRTGEKSRHKIVQISGLTLAEVTSVLESCCSS